MSDLDSSTMYYRSLCLVSRFSLSKPRLDS